MKFFKTVILAIIFLINMNGCSAPQNTQSTMVAFSITSTLIPLFVTPAISQAPTQISTKTLVRPPERASTLTAVILPTMDFIETDYSHFFDAYPPMVHVSYTPNSPGYEYWTPIVNELTRKLEIPDCKDWMMVQVIDTRWDDIFEHYKVTIVDNGWTLLSSTNNQTSVVDGQTYNLGVLHYDVGGDKERIILVFDSQPELGNPYYILFFFDER